MFWFPAFVLGVVVGAWCVSFFREPARKEIVLVFSREQKKSAPPPPPPPPPNPSPSRRIPAPDFGA